MADDGREPEAEEKWKLGMGIMERLGGRGAGMRVLLGVRERWDDDMALAADTENVGDKARCMRDVDCSGWSSKLVSEPADDTLFQ